jgi:hypothetical protein
MQKTEREIISEMSKEDRLDLAIKLAKSANELRTTVKELTAEIAGKNSVLNNAFKDVEKGHPHWEVKSFILKQLPIDEKNLADGNKRLLEIPSLIDLCMGVSNG